MNTNYSLVIRCTVGSTSDLEYAFVTTSPTLTTPPSSTFSGIVELVDVKGNYETASGKFKMGQSTVDTAHVDGSGNLILDKAATTVSGGRAQVNVSIQP